MPYYSVRYCAIRHCTLPCLHVTLKEKKRIACSLPSLQDLHWAKFIKQAQKSEHTPSSNFSRTLPFSKHFQTRTARYWTSFFLLAAAIFNKLWIHTHLGPTTHTHSLALHVAFSQLHFCCGHTPAVWVSVCVGPYPTQSTAPCKCIKAMRCLWFGECGRQDACVCVCVRR